MFNYKRILRWFIISIPFLAIALLLILTVGRLAIFPREKPSGSRETRSRKEEPTKDVINMSTAKVNDFKLILSTNKKSYRRGESIQVELVIKNDSSSEKILSYGSGQEFDFWVQDEGGSEVWRWSENKSFIMALKDIKLRPGEEKTYDISWNQKNSSQIQVPAGKYSIVAQSVAAELKDGQVEISIEIEK